MSITKTHDGFSTQEEAMTAINAAGYYPMLLDVPPEANEDHWHDFDTIIFILEGENIVTEAATGKTLVCGPGSRIDFPRGVVHHENHKGYRALFGFSVDLAKFAGPINMAPNHLPNGTKDRQTRN